VCKKRHCTKISGFFSYCFQSRFSDWRSAIFNLKQKRHYFTVSYFFFCQILFIFINLLILNGRLLALFNWGICEFISSNFFWNCVSFYSRTVRIKVLSLLCFIPNRWGNYLKKWLEGLKGKSIVVSAYK